MKKLCCFLFLFLLSFQANSENISIELFKTINQRLSYMEDVALFKAQNQKAIEDVEREQVVIENAVRTASKHGLDPLSVVGFFEAQISVAKAIQYRYRADLLSAPSMKSPRDLQTIVRPALIRLGGQIIRQMKQVLSESNSFKSVTYSDFEASMDVRYVTSSDKQLLFDALMNVKLSSEN